VTSTCFDDKQVLTGPCPASGRISDACPLAGHGAAELVDSQRRAVGPRHAAYWRVVATVNCICRPGAIDRNQLRLSGPLLDPTADLAFQVA
jgi:hypothetical protein